jgi:HK97 family phage portal protein
VGLFSRASVNLPASEFIPRRPPATKLGTAVVTNDTALRHSAVWACLRLRANLISTMPLDVFRRVNGIQVEQSTVVSPGGDEMDIAEWLYSTQFDLDRAGNAFGVITERWHVGNIPSRIELVPLSEVTLSGKGGKITSYRIAGKMYDPADVWHERQFTVPGMPIGLSPVAYAAWVIGEYLSIQDFAMGWFGSGGVPKAALRNTKLTTLTDDQATKIKDRFKSTVSAGDVFVSGADWEYKMIQAQQTGSEWIDAKKLSVGEIGRFFDVPGDLIDSPAGSQHITYANVTQRNLQFLIMHLGPAIIRRETSLGKLLPKPLYVKLNTDALLRMDPMSRAQLIKTQIESRTITPNEARELDNRSPLTQNQIGELLTFFPPPRSVEAGAGLEQPPVAPTTEGAL